MDPTKVPAARPPHNGTPDFDSPQNRAALYIAVSSVLIALTIISVAGKLYVKIFIQRKPGWDDAATVVATVGQMAYTGIVVWIMNHGAGRHMWDVRLSTFLKEVSLSHILSIIQQPTLLAAKLALFGLYYRLFSPKDWIRYTIHAGIVFCITFYTAMMFLFIFLKNNAELILVNKALGIVNLVTDIYIFVLPLMAISILHMPLKRKIGVGAVFMAGLLAVAMSILSIVFRFQLTTATSDVTWEFFPKLVTLTVEIDVGIICGCVPTLPALFQKSSTTQWFFSKFKSLTSRLLGSRGHSKRSSIKQSHGYENKRLKNNNNDDYVELQEARNTHRQVSMDVTSSRISSLGHDAV